MQRPTNYNTINGRFKDAPWYTGSLKEEVLVIGAGGISSNAMYYMTKSVPATYYLLDFDVVAEHNIGTQFFTKDQIGKPKVHALCDTLGKFTDTDASIIRSLNSKYNTEYKPIMVIGVDNMGTRKAAFEEWRKHDNRELFIEGRLRATLYEIYIVVPGRESEYEKTLFSDSEVDEGPCTFKQTAYFGGLIGARIAHVLVNYLCSKHIEGAKDMYELPFSIKEIGDLFYVEFKNI